jgi:hypothetical protein
MNCRPRLSSLFALLVTSMSSLPATAQLLNRKPVPVKMTMYNDTKLSVELLGRDKEMVTFREPGKQLETALMPKAIKWVDFGINLDTNGVNDLCFKQDFVAAGTKLNQLLSPLLIYLDLPSDLPDQTMLLLKCLYRSGKHGEAITLSNVIVNTLPDEDKKKQAKAYKVLSLLALKNRWEANLLLKSIGDVAKTNSIAALYYYAAAQVQLSYSNWVGAQEYSGKVIAFCPRNEDWMAPALVLSAQCYAHDEQYAVAEQTLHELSVAFRKSTWPETIKPLQEEYKRLREEQEARKNTPELPEERAKRETKNLLKDEPKKENNHDKTNP